MFLGDGLLLGTFCFSGHRCGVPPPPAGSVWKTNLGHSLGVGRGGWAAELHEVRVCPRTHGEAGV